MEIKFSQERLKFLLSKDYQIVSTNGIDFYWTCSTLSKSGNCVDIIRIDDSGEWVDTIFVKNITHIYIRNKKGMIKKEVEHEND